MGAVSVPSFSSIIPKRCNMLALSIKSDQKKFLLCCHGGAAAAASGPAGPLGKAIKSSSLSSALTERSTTSSASSSMDSASLVLSPNGKVPKMVEMQDGIGIVQFLRGKSFLITGATGFLAKVLVEKILRTEPEVDKIFLLIKAKNKEAAMERLKNEIINAEIFKCLQQTYGKSYQAFMLSKLVPVMGNVCDNNIGMEDNAANMIAQEVDIIVNSAANTTFDERYDVSLDINTKGPTRILNFAKKCHKLKLFIQVSTAYVNGQRLGRIMEKPFAIGDSIAGESSLFQSSNIAPPTLKVEDELKWAMQSKDALGNSLAASQKMRELGLERAKKYGWQDTYVFTKAMGEMLIDSMRGEVPVVIVRPSVIESTYREPFPGWMEGNRMMDPIVLYYGRGLLTGFLVDPKGVIDVVPADMVVNATLAAMAKHGSSSKSEINLYQVASSVVNPLVFKDLASLLYDHFSLSPFLDAKGRPIEVTDMKLFTSMEDFSSHLWKDANRRIESASATSNGNCKLAKKLENIYKKTVEKAKHLADIYQPYTFYSGRFDNSNTERLMKLMSEEEMREFGFDVGSIDWRDYISNVHIPGLRKHVMKERRV
ncbi:fatty acyl-CoA reductase 2, chloroplastic [Impatiens glandulifera]|uniref:fatty acyl-CoA reductase 2, chloroplastic n=1 Tax=Impatiens glandulifera TaxID=253017 RepID=UPI001FB0AA4D|nr:fatty acyl-CoA reductase 2, chloroplastic [Impatiens glandulifera]